MLASLFSTCLKYSMFIKNPYAVGIKPSKEIFPQWLHSDAIWQHISVNAGSCNGLLTDSSKSLPEPMLTKYQWSCVALTWEQFHRKCSRYISFISVWKLLIWYYTSLHQGKNYWFDIRLASTRATEFTNWGRDKMAAISRRHFQMYFLEWKCINFG